MSRAPSFWSRLFGGISAPRRDHGGGTEPRVRGHGGGTEPREHDRETRRHDPHGRPRHH